MAAAISFSIPDCTNALSLGSFSNWGRSMFRLTYLVIDPAEELSLLLGVVVVDDDDEKLFWLRELLGAVAVECEENVLLLFVAILLLP